MSDSEKEIINTLVELRHEQYSSKLVNRIPDTDYPAIKALAIKLGEKILKANHPVSANYNRAKIQFNSTINELFKQDVRFNMATFAAQLLQYYTVISHPEFEPVQNIEEFVRFLIQTPQLGETGTNLFVTEYKLIKIYNDLCDFVDVKAGVIAPIVNMPARVEFLVAELEKIKSQVTKWLNDAPDNIFVHYLNFALNYCFAKVLELQFISDKTSLSDDERIFLATLQDAFLEQTKKSLTEIEQLKARNVPFLYGIEFNLGQEVFNKLPSSDLESLQAHVNFLLHL